MNTSTPPVAVFGETLNLSRFAGPTHEAILRTYIEQKYSDVGFGVIVAVGASAFDLATRWRSELWPGVPVVFAAIDEMTAAEFKLDHETTGLIMRRTIRSMMAAAHVLVPDLQGVAVLGGSLEKDPYRLQYRRELAELTTETQLTNLTGLPLALQVSLHRPSPTEPRSFTPGFSSMMKGRGIFPPQPWLRSPKQQTAR